MDQLEGRNVVFEALKRGALPHVWLGGGFVRAEGGGAGGGCVPAALRVDRLRDTP